MNIQRIYHKGFTIVELLVVIVVIGILVTLSVVAYNGIQQGARDKSVLSDLDALDGIETDYGIKNSVSGIAYYSGNTSDVATLGFTPSDGNVIDVVVNSTDYCIRGYNPNGNKNSISNSYTKESTPGACVAQSASLSAGGTGGGSALVGWWKLNGNASDSSGNGNNGTISGAVPTNGQTGLSNTAYSFNGSGQYITIPTVHDIAQGTIGLWAKLASTQPSVNFYIFSHPGGATNNRIYINTNSTGTSVNSRLGTGTTIGSSSITASTWHFLVLTWSGTNATLYIDGTDATTTSVFSGFTATVPSSYLGCFSNAGGECINGSVDDVRIYTRALNGSEVSSLYSAGAQ